VESFREFVKIRGEFNIETLLTTEDSKYLAVFPTVKPEHRSIAQTAEASMGLWAPAWLYVNLDVVKRCSI